MISDIHMAFSSLAGHVGRFRWQRLIATIATCLVAAAPARAQQPLSPENLTIEKIADGYGITEGPIWHPAGYLLFVDVNASRIYKWTPEKGVEVYRDSTGRANGIGIDADGQLVVAQRDRRLSRFTADGREVLLADRYQGKRLNSPNDIAMKSDGTVYFTDPTFGVRKEDAELTHKGVYRYLRNGTLELLASDLNMPNGLAFSPDERRLYVNDSAEHHMRVFDVNADGTLANGRVFATLKDETKTGDPDGMEVDKQGNVYSAGPGGVWIFAPDGTLKQRIPIPEEHTTNLAWGGPDGRTMFVTAVSRAGDKFVGRVYRVRSSASTGGR
jgi:sugar lactone lactonase YvrE